jgi:predicted AAA+ superfamily ATPase
VRELARSNKLNLIEINFELEPTKKTLFTDNDPKKVLIALEVSLGKQIQLNNTLLFLDEIQAFPLILAKLRWFKELMPELAVIVAGSLLEFVLDKHDFSMPVGRISYLHLEPLSFDEFLYAKNSKMLDFLNEYNWEEIPPAIHQQALAYLQEYTLVGGLPAAMSVWLEQNSLIAVQQIHHDILSTYRDDFARYKGRYDIQLFDDVFNYVPKNIGHKVIYSHISLNASAASTKQIFQLITKARVIHTIRASSGNGIPLAAESNDKYIKTISLDVGLMNRILGINLHDFKSVSDIEVIHKGAIAEQLVGQLLRTIEPYYTEPALYYWQRSEAGSNAEVDYLIQQGSKIIPIEVKAGTRGTMQSLHLFMKLKQLPTAIRFNANTPSRMKIEAKTSSGEVQYQLLSLPLYMVGQLRRLLEQNA